MNQLFSQNPPITEVTQLSTGEKVEIYSFLGLGVAFVGIGYWISDQDLQQWGVMLMMLGFIFLLSYREYIRSKILLPGQVLEAYSHVIRLIRSAKGFLRIIDLYPGETTIKAISTAPEGIPVKWLTMNQMNKKDLIEFEAIASRLVQLRPEIEIRYAPKGALHDRFLLTEPHGWTLGQSIKDIGKKLGAVNPLSKDDTDEAVVVFDEIWEKSTPI